MIEGRGDYKIQELRLSKLDSNGKVCLIGSIIYAYKYPQCETDEQLKEFDAFIENCLNKLDGYRFEVNPYPTRGRSFSEWISTLSCAEVDIPLLPKYEDYSEKVIYPTLNLILYNCKPRQYKDLVPVIDRIDYGEPIGTDGLNHLRQIISYWTKHHYELHEVLHVVYFKGNPIGDMELKEFYCQNVFELCKKYSDLKDTTIELRNETSAELDKNYPHPYRSYRKIINGVNHYYLINNTERSFLLNETEKKRAIYDELDKINGWVTNLQ